MPITFVVARLMPVTRLFDPHVTPTQLVLVPVQIGFDGDPLLQDQPDLRLLIIAFGLRAVARLHITIVSTAA